MRDPHRQAEATAGNRKIKINFQTLPEIDRGVAVPLKSKPPPEAVFQSWRIETDEIAKQIKKEVVMRKPNRLEKRLKCDLMKYRKALKRAVAGEGVICKFEGGSALIIGRGREKSEIVDGDRYAEIVSKITKREAIGLLRDSIKESKKQLEEMEVEHFEKFHPKKKESVKSKDKQKSGPKDE